MKKSRHETIVRMVENEVIRTQEDILIRLREEGFDVTQATVSRDIKTLGLVKSIDADGNYKYSVVNPAESRTDNNLISVFSNSVINVASSGNIVALICHSGMASAAAAVLDSIKNEHVIASIAGDDTIFVLCNDENAAKLFLQFCQKFIN